jgi:HMGL-like
MSGAGELTSTKDQRQCLKRNCYGSNRSNNGITTMIIVKTSIWNALKPIIRFPISRYLHNIRPLTISDSIRIVEVGPRDGLQNERIPVVTEDKVALIMKLAEAGCSYIEAGSFVSKKAVPSMANSLDVISKLANPAWRNLYPDLVLACLVPSIKYFPDAINAKVDEIAIFVSASETFSQKVRMIVDL